MYQTNHTFFISALLRAVPIMIDFLQALEANICLTLVGRHVTPYNQTFYVYEPQS